MRVLFLPSLLPSVSCLPIGRAVEHCLSSSVALVVKRVRRYLRWSGIVVFSYRWSLLFLRRETCGCSSKCALPLLWCVESCLLFSLYLYFVFHNSRALFDSIPCACFYLLFFWGLAVFVSVSCS